VAAPAANSGAMAVEGPQRGQALRPGNAAAAFASSVMQLEGAQLVGGRGVSFVQEPAPSGRPDTFDFTAQKMDGADPDMDVENNIQGAGGLFVGGGARKSRSQSRGKPLNDIDSSSNAFNSFCGPRAAARGPPSAVVMRKFPTTLSYRSGEIVSAAKSDTIAADRPPLCKAEYVHCDGSAMRMKSSFRNLLHRIPLTSIQYSS